MLNSPDSSSNSISSEIKQDSLDKKQDSLDKKQDSLDKKQDSLEIKQDSLDKKQNSSEKKSSSEFLCKVRYLNNLPEIPFTPKLLETSFKDLKFHNYAATSLERNYKFVLHTEPDLGIPINLIDPNLYNLDAGGPVNTIDQKFMSADPYSQLKKSDARPNVKWLRKTEYISSSDWSHSSTPTKLTKKSLAELENEQITIDQILETFNQAKETPKHPTNPSLKPEVIYEVFPGFDFWTNTYSQLMFDSHPAPKLPDTTPSEEEFLAQNAIIKGFQSAEENFLGFCAPKKRKSLEEPLMEQGETSIEYEWIREYKYDMKKGDEFNNAYFFTFSDEKKEAYYNQIDTRITLTKFKPKDIQYPSSITLYEDDFNEEELSQREEKIHLLILPEVKNQTSLLPKIRRDGPIHKKPRLASPTLEESKAKVKEKENENENGNDNEDEKKETELSDNEED